MASNFYPVTKKENRQTLDTRVLMSTSRRER